uniref:hypothetical protein RF1 n=1 Tax=Hydnora esculenta TaxID=1851369 RepID=UPI0021141FCB|nr:hypothetical protein RF1 [Hydnora esculenta]USN93647.1 hypothetical protein RF1 [Hydnora esculenta]
MKNKIYKNMSKMYRQIKYLKYLLKHKMLFRLFNFFFGKNIIFVKVLGLLYGVMTFSLTGPLYFFILLIITGAEIKNTQIPAIIGFFIGQIIICASIFYIPLYNLLSKPHTITAIIIFLLILSWYNRERLKSKVTKKKFIFLIHLLLQLLNFLIIPSSSLKRSMNFYIFQAYIYKKQLFLISFFIGNFIVYIVFLILVTLIFSDTVKNVVLEIFPPHKRIYKSIYICYAKFYHVLLYITYFFIFGRIPFIFRDRSYNFKKKKSGLKHIIKKKKELEKKTLLKYFFDIQCWGKPTRYIKNRRTANFVRKEMSQYFFSIFNEKNNKFNINIFHTYSPNLYNFLKLINEVRILKKSNSNKDKTNEITDNWYFKNEFYDRVNLLNKDLYTKKIINFSDAIETKARLFDYIEESKKNILKVSLNLHEFNQNKISDSFSSFLKILYDDINTFREIKHLRKKYFFEKKKLPKWLYKLVSEAHFSAAGLSGFQPGVRSRKLKRVVALKTRSIKKDKKTGKEKEQIEESVFLRYVTQPDSRKNVIRGAMRTKRRKVCVYHLFQETIYSPLFAAKNYKKLKLVFFSWPINILNKLKKKKVLIIKKDIYKETDPIGNYQAKLWDAFPISHMLRGTILMMHSRLRKNIILPSLIIVKNLGRLLLLQSPEFYEDFKELDKELHIKCTFNGVQLSKTEFPKQWQTEGMQIKVLFPFKLKPWRSSKYKKRKPFFLTFLGNKTKIPYGKPMIEKSYFFKPIFRYINKKLNRIIRYIKSILYNIKNAIKKILDIIIEIKKNKQDLYKKNEEEYNIETHIIKLDEKIRLLKKITPDIKLINNTNINNLIKRKIKRIKFKTQNLIFFVLKKKTNFIKKKIIENIICLNKFIIKILNKCIYQINKSNEKNIIYKINFKFVRDKNNEQSLSQAYVLYKIIQQNTNKISFYTWNDLLNSNQFNIKKIPLPYNHKKHKIYEYSKLAISYLNRNDNYLANLKYYIDNVNDIKEHDRLVSLQKKYCLTEIKPCFDLDTLYTVEENRIIENNLIEIKEKEKEDEKNLINLSEKDKQKKEWDDFFDKWTLYQLQTRYKLIKKRMIDNIKTYSLLLRLINKEAYIKDMSYTDMFYSALKKKEIDLYLLGLNNMTLQEIKERDLFETHRIFIPKYKKLNHLKLKYFYIHQLISLSFTTEFLNRDLDLCFIPEKLLSVNHCREWRIKTNFNLYNSNLSSLLFNDDDEFIRNVKRYVYYNNSKDICNFKKYLWPSFMLEDLACINRYWFNTNDGSRFNILRIRMYIRNNKNHK